MTGDVSKRIVAKVSQYLSSNREVTVKDMTMDLLLSESSVRKALNVLMAQGLVVKVKRYRGTRYKWIKERD